MLLHPICIINQVPSVGFSLALVGDKKYIRIVMKKTGPPNAFENVKAIAVVLLVIYLRIY